MALPSGYTSKEMYFKDAITFLEKYAWIYQNSNTAFIKADIFGNFTAEFYVYFSKITNAELNEFPLLKLNNGPVQTIEANNVIYEFCKELLKLTPSKAYAEPVPENIDLSLKLKLHKVNQKKQHEIQKLAQIINTLCKDDIDMLIDFGSGLGYLGEMICTLSNNKFLLLSLEADAARVETAKKRQTAFMPKAAQKCCWKQQFITELSAASITQSITDLAKLNGINSPRVAIIGLHACGDLTITAIKLFFELGTHIRKLIIMPCCYHKLEFGVDNKVFRNFPLSQTLKVIVKNYKNYTVFLNRPFLRLACQQTLKRWCTMTAEEHKNHGLDMLKRGIAEAIINSDTEYVVKRKAKESEIKVSAENIGSFHELCQIYKLHSKSDDKSIVWTKAHELQYNKLLKKYGTDGYIFAEGLTCLQTAMQKLCENIVLYDRLCYIEEYATAKRDVVVEEHQQQEQEQEYIKSDYASANLKVNVRCEKLLDEKLSPRCYVLIAEKL